MTAHPRSGGYDHPSPESAHGADSSVRHEADRSAPAGREDDSAFGAGVDTAKASAPSGSRPRTRRRRRSSPAAKDSASADSGTAAQAEADPSADGDAPATPRRRRGKRGGRRRRATKASKAADAPADEPETAAKASEAPRAETTTGDGDDDDARTRSRRRGKRGGRRRRKATGGALEIESIPGEDDDLPDLAELPADAVLVADDDAKPRRRRKAKTAGGKKATKKKTTRSRKAASDGKPTRKRSRSRSIEEDDEPVATAEVVSKQTILVNAADPEETRVAVVEDGRLVDLQLDSKRHNSYVNDIYRARVVNLETAIGAAFIDFGQGRNGFLHASDVLGEYGEKDWSLEKLLTTKLDSDDWDEDSSQPSVGAELDDDEESEDETETKSAKKPAAGGRGRGKRGGGPPRRTRQRKPIEQLLKKGQSVVVQVTKDAIGDKGPTLTTYISIPGRYIVLMPSLSRTGVSRKIEDERERRRLKRILAALDIPEGMGVIVRTAGVGKKKEEIKLDLETLLVSWDEFGKRLKKGSRPAPLYRESDAATRTLRDLFTAHTERVVVDAPEVHERMLEFVRRMMPEHEDRIIAHDGPRPLFHTYGVEQDFEKLFARRHELPAGGSIVIEETEALVAIDVNSGKTRQEGAEFEDIALKTNLEAAREIARQVRLRDLGGILVLDFIDMMRPNSRRAVERELRDQLAGDRARSKLGRISQFGLLEMTRQRLGPGLSKIVHSTCVRCRGTGRARTESSRSQAILRRLGAALQLKGFTSVEVRTHPEVIEYLQRDLGKELAALEEESGKKLVLISVPDQVEDSVLHYLRADGREVRPGGRRKR